MSVMYNPESTDNFSFSAIRGIQAGREYYVVMCPLKLIPRMFLYNEKEIPPQLRAQRVINKARIPEMMHYILNNRDHYVFSSITASVDGSMTFIPVKKEGTLSKVGTLIIPMDARFLINDGQHRRAAIESALSIKPELSSETISVVFYADRGLKHSQQMFSDLNKYAVRPTTSINMLYDCRDDFAQAILQIIEKVPIFSRGLTELEKTSVSNRGNKVFTLNSIYASTRLLLGKTGKKSSMSEEEKLRAIEFWNEVYHNMPEWQQVVSGNITPSKLREEYVHVYGIVMNALGSIGFNLMQKYPFNWKSKLKKLSQINWKRSNKDWNGKIIINNKISKSKGSIDSMANYIAEQLRIKMTKRNFNGN